MSNKDTFPGSLHVQWEAADHVLRETLVLAAGWVESRERENGCLSRPCHAKKKKKEKAVVLKIIFSTILQYAKPALCTLRNTDIVKENDK